MQHICLLPEDLVLDIINDWLGSMKDFSSLDRAVTNKEMRCCLFPAMKKRKIRFEESIQIYSAKKLKGLIEWKEKRLLEIRNICWGHNGAHLPHFGSHLTDLKELKITNRKLRLQDIFCIYLPHLEKLSLFGCPIITEGLKVECIFTLNLKELDFEKIRLRDDNSDTGDDITSFFFWIGKCCPKVEKLRLHKCQSVVSKNIIPMIQTLAALKDLHFHVVPSVEEISNIIMSPVERRLGKEQLDLSSFPRIETLYLSGSTVVGTPNYPAGDHLLNVLFQCCSTDQQVLQNVDICIDYVSSSAQDHLLQHIHNHWQQVKHLTLQWYNKNTDIGVYLHACLETCLQLETLEFVGVTWQDEFMLSIAQQAHLLQHLQCLSFRKLPITTSSIALLCQSPLSEQLTTLKLIDINSFDIEACHLIVSSFPQLQTFVLEIVARVIMIPDEYVQRDESEMKRAHHLNLVQWLNILFSEQCVFAKTLQALSLSFGSSLISIYWDLSKSIHQPFSNSLFYDHMLPYWQFSFPALHTFSFIWKVNHHKMSLLTRRIAMNCPRLHTLLLDFCSNVTAAIVDCKHQRELIRKLQDI